MADESNPRTGCKVFRLIVAGFILASTQLSCGGGVSEPGSSEEGSIQQSPQQRNIPSVDEFDSAENLKRTSVRIIAFGDFGQETSDFRKTMDMYQSRGFNPDLVFLLGDNTYQALSSVDDYSVYFDYVAKDCRAPHFAVMGNYDHQYEMEDLMVNQIHKVDSRWNMPMIYYFQKFQRSDFNICVWFIDTEILDERTDAYKRDPSRKGRQLKWLNDSIKTEKVHCTWTFLVGHVPTQVQASGQNKGSWWVAKSLQPIMDNYNIDLYLSAHHHNTQHLTHTKMKTNYFIVGQVSLSHGFRASDPPNKESRLVWGTGEEPAILELNISSKTIRYAIHSGYRKTGGPIHSGVINHNR